MAFGLKKGSRIAPTSRRDVFQRKEGVTSVYINKLLNRKALITLGNKGISSIVIMPSLFGLGVKGEVSHCKNLWERLRWIIVDWVW